MKKLSDFIERPLRLVKKAFFSREYELFAGEDILGLFQYRLAFIKRGIVVGLENRNIEFYKENFWSRKIFIREEGKEFPFANYERDFINRKGNIFLPNGNKLVIRFGFFDVETEIQDENEKTIITMKRPNVFANTVNLVYKEKSSLVDDNPWIVFLALYLIIKRRQRRR